MAKKNTNRRPQTSKAPKSGNQKFREADPTRRKSEPYRRNTKHKEF